MIQDLLVPMSPMNEAAASITVSTAPVVLTVMFAAFLVLRVQLMAPQRLPPPHDRRRHLLALALGCLAAGFFSIMALTAKAAHESSGTTPLVNQTARALIGWPCILLDLLVTRAPFPHAYLGPVTDPGFAPATLSRVAFGAISTYLYFR